MTLTITQETTNDEIRLFAQATGQSKIEMLAIAPLEFRAKELNIKLVFNHSTRDEKIMDSLELHQAGMVMEAKLIDG